VAQHLHEQRTPCGSHAIGHKSTHEAQAAAIEDAGGEEGQDFAALRAMLVKDEAAASEPKLEAVLRAHRPIGVFVVQKIVLLHEADFADELHRYQHRGAAHEGQFPLHLGFIDSHRGQRHVLADVRARCIRPVEAASRQGVYGVGRVVEQQGRADDSHSRLPPSTKQEFDQCAAFDHGIGVQEPEAGKVIQARGPDSHVAAAGEP